MIVLEENSNVLVLDVDIEIRRYLDVSISTRFNAMFWSIAAASSKLYLTWLIINNVVTNSCTIASGTLRFTECSSN